MAVTSHYLIYIVFCLFSSVFNSIFFFCISLSVTSGILVTKVCRIAYDIVTDVWRIVYAIVLLYHSPVDVAVTLQSEEVKVRLVFELYFYAIVDVKLSLRE